MSSELQIKLMLFEKRLCFLRKRLKIEKELKIFEVVKSGLKSIAEQILGTLNFLFINFEDYIRHLHNTD